MDVMFTTHPDDEPGKYYMVVAEAHEWSEILEFLDCGTFGSHESYLKATELKEKLAGWGIN